MTTVEGIEIEIAGEAMIALPSFALYWPTEATLFVADLHLGKAATFRAASIPLPPGTTDATLARLGRATGSVDAKRLVVLGDLWHAREGRTSEIEGKLCAWRDQRPALRIDLVSGNHDLKTGRRTEIGGIIEADEIQIGPFVCRHHPAPSDDGYVLCGHLHPCFTLKGKGNQSMCLPCFWFGEFVGVLPAFGEFTGNSRIEPDGNDRVLAVGGGTVTLLRT